MSSESSSSKSAKKIHKVIVTPEFAHYPRDWHFSPGLNTGDFIFLSGITGTRSDGSIAAEPEGQFREAFRILQANLVQAGLAMRDVVDIATYHVGLRKHLRVFMKVKDEYLLEPYPAWTAIGVSELITEGALVEIRAIANAKSDHDRPFRHRGVRANGTYISLSHYKCPYLRTRSRASARGLFSQG